MPRGFVNRILRGEYLDPNWVRIENVEGRKCRILRWAGHVARIEEGRRTFKILGIGQMRLNGKLRRLYNEELHSLYRSTNIFRVSESRR